MTSRNLFFKLMKEDLKSRLWAVALMSLGCFFLYPVVAAFMAGEIKDYLVYEEGVLRYSRELISWLSFDCGMTVFLIVVTSLVCGLSGFSYLNNKSKVDFYHGIPVRREKLYAANYINGILLLAVPYAVCMLLAVFIGISNGAEAGRLWPVAVAAYGLHMTYYILMYTTIVIASMMTGNLIVGFLGSAVFAAVVPLAATIVFGYFSTFFKTYVYEMHENTMKLFLHFSPVSEYMTQISRYSEGKSVVPAALAALVISAMLAVLGCVLYKKRPSEAAGRAMAFAVTRPVIRNILTVVSSLGLGLFFWAMRESTGWAVFGVICGGVICHCVIEIIYHFDFKKLFSHKWQLAACVVFAVAVLFAFRYDLAGYDRYLPQAGEVKEAAVNVSRLNNWVSYGSVGTDRDGNYSWEHGDADDYIFANMHYQDAENLLSIAAEGIRVCEEEKRLSRYVDSQAEIPDTSQEQKNYSVVTIAYTLSSGRRVCRTYHMCLEDVMPQIEKLYADSRFQTGTYPLMGKTADQMAAVHYRDYGDEQILDQLSQAELGELLEAYQKEFSSMTIAKMSREFPVGLIRFSSELEETAMRWQRAKENEKTYYYYYQSFDDRNYYPVYPSFTKTIQLLKKHQISLETGYKPEDIKSIEIRQYQEKQENGYASEVKELVITDAEEIRQLSQVLCNGRMQYYDSLFRWENLDAELTLQKDGKTYNYNVYIPEGKVPEFISSRLSEIH